MTVGAVELNTAGERRLKCELEQYNCLVPGEGVDCYVRWHPDNDFVGDAKTLDRKLPENRWRVRPPWIGLAHELIHAWRYVTGRCIFTERSTAEENLLDEQLTTGVPPFMQGKYTENSIRYYAFQVMRPFYGSDHGR